MVETDLDWVSSDNLDAFTTKLLDGLANTRAETYAASVDASGYDGDVLRRIYAVTTIPAFEVGVVFDVKTQEIVWAFRHAPDRCDACGVIVDEGGGTIDSEGTRLCEGCAT